MPENKKMAPSAPTPEAKANAKNENINNHSLTPYTDEVKPVDEDALCELSAMSDNLLQLSRLLVSSYFEMAPDKDGKSPDDLWFSASYEVIAATVRIMSSYAFNLRNGLDAVLDRRPTKGGAA